MIFVKICGITNVKDALIAAEEKSSAIGFVTYKKSKRFISAKETEKICSCLSHKNTIRKVAVCVDLPANEIEDYINAGINTLQLHGNENHETASELIKVFKKQIPDFEVWKVIKAKKNIRISMNSVIEDIKNFKSFPCDKFLIDTFSVNTPGGTGEICNWDAARFYVKNLDRPVILAGGLNCENVIEAIREIHPFGVDVSTGVEKSPGKKSHELIKRFLRLCNRAPRLRSPDTQK